MTDTATIAERHDLRPAPPVPPPGGLRRLTRAGWVRVAWLMPLFFGIGTALGPGLRALIGYAPIWDPSVWTTVELTTVPIGFLAGLGGFDYWVRYALGAPTRPEDHSGHGARSWTDYFRSTPTTR